MGTFKLCCAVGAVLALLAGSAGAAPFNPAVDFSASANPNGVWRYGYVANLNPGYALVTETDNSFVPPFRGWTGALSGDRTPGVFMPSDGASHVSGTVAIDPDRLNLHPAPGGELQVVRFTAPAAGVYTLSNLIFNAQDTAGTTTDVHVIVNGTTHLYDGTVTGPYAAPAAPAPLAAYAVSLAAGGTIDFAVGNGGNGYASDSTGLRVSIDVPEPAGAACFAGIFALGMIRRRR